MFSLSLKAQYGLAALVELSYYHRKRLVQIKEIVEKHDIPKTYLEQIFNRLVKTGIVQSVRGNRGGYELAEDPASITVLQVLEHLEGEIQISQDRCLYAGKELFDRIKRKVREMLNVTLAELAERQKQYEQGPMFHI